jgi:hypothetical protein
LKGIKGESQYFSSIERKELPVLISISKKLSFRSGGEEGKPRIMFLAELYLKNG